MKTKTLLLVALLMSAAVVNAKVWRVNPTTGSDADFTSIQEAVDKRTTADGDTLLCEPGLHAGANVNKRFIIIGAGKGADKNGVYQVATEFSTTLSAGHDSIVIIGCKGLIHLHNHTHCRVERCSGELDSYSAHFATVKSCIFSGLDAGGANSTIIGNIVTGKLSVGSNSTIVNNTVGNYISATHSLIQDNIVLGSNPFNGNYDGNTITHNILTLWQPIANIPNNYFIEATKKGLFGNENPNAWNPQEWQITEADEFGAKTSSSKGGECGAFGGLEPFVFGQRPFGMPYIYDVEIPSTVVGDQLNINFKVGIQNE